MQIVATEPQAVRKSNLEPIDNAFYAAQNAVFRQGDILFMQTTGATSGKTPAPTGSMATLAGPQLATGQGVFSIPLSSSSITSGNVTIAGAAVSGAPKAAYFVLVSYTATTNESLTSQEFIVVCNAGVMPTIQVNSAGAPAAATNFAAYVGVAPQGELLQQTTKTTTALGSAFTVPNPLTNNVGVAACAAGQATNIVGMARNDWDAMYYSGVAGQINNRSLFGANRSISPLAPLNEILQVYVTSLRTIDLAMNLVQTFLPSVNFAVGLNVDPSSNATGWMVADTSETQVGNAFRGSGGVTNGPLNSGTFLDTYARVVVRFLDSVLIA